MSRMQRTQIYLEPELARSLDRLASRRGSSRAQLIREAMREVVRREENRSGSILELAGVGQSGVNDTAERHDEYLVEDKLEKSRP